MKSEQFSAKLKDHFPFVMVLDFYKFKLPDRQMAGR